MSEYDVVQKGSLKLKKSALSAELAIKKKKKKKKPSEELKRRILEQEVTTGGDSSCDDGGPSGSKRRSDGEKKTKAELAFQKAKAERMVKEITTKVSKSHKERIMEFNEYLDNLSEHYDIPKVSWTK
jgi:protein FAM32A